MYARFVLDEVWRELGYAVKPREVVEIYIHIYMCETQITRNLYVI